MIYGVQESTDSRNYGHGTVKKFRKLSAAIEWREEIGPRGVGQSFSRENGHRYIRRLYDLTGMRRPGKVELAKIICSERDVRSEEDALAIWAHRNGTRIETANVVEARCG